MSTLSKIQRDVYTEPPALCDDMAAARCLVGQYGTLRVQNCLTRVVLQDNYNSATSLLSELHWLPVNKRIKNYYTRLRTSHLLLVSRLICLRY